MKTMYKLRDYQKEAVTQCIESLNKGNNPLICLPTASGKSLVAATLAKKLSKKGKVLIAAHRKELIEQNSDIYRKSAGDSYSVYSASCNEKNLTGQVVFAQIQSLHRAKLIPHFEYIIIDECHLISTKSETMYQQLFAMMSNSHRVGLTATPYRLDSGTIIGDTGASFNDLCTHIKAKELIPQYLSPLIGVTNENEIDTQCVHSRGGDYIVSELEQIVCNDTIVQNTCGEMLRCASDRNHILVFATSVNHAEMIVEYLEQKEESVALITGQTDKELRHQYLQCFLNSDIRFLVNVNVLTTGVDLPLIDCISLMRPTQSKSLYVQQLGRGMRKSPDKENCKILDFSGNIIRHGDIDVFEEYRNIKHEQEMRDIEEERKNSKARPLKIGALDSFSDPLHPPDILELNVNTIKYTKIPARKHPGLTNVIAEYDCGTIKVKKFLCPEYSSGASWFAHQWLKNRGWQGGKITNANRFIDIACRYPVPFSISAFRNKQGYWEIKVEHYAE